MVLGCVVALLLTTVTGRDLAQAEPPATAVVPVITPALTGFGISADELKLYNSARQMAFRPPTAGPVAPSSPLVMAGAPWFTSNSFSAAWSMVGTAKTPFTFYRWLMQLQDTFAKDASDFQKVAVALMLVPIVGDALGVARASINRDPGGVVVNLLYLLSGIASRIGLTGASLALGVVAFVAWAVVNIVASVQVGSDPTDVGSMIDKRDAAWHDTVAEALRTKTVAELIGGAEKLFAQGRENLVLNAQVALAMIDQQARETVGGGAAVVEAARAAKKQIIAHTEAMVQALRSGFVKGAHSSLDATFKQLNAGEGAAEFTREFMKTQIRPQWMDLYARGWSCYSTGLSAQEARKCYDNLPREAGYDGPMPTPGIQDAVQEHGVHSVQAREMLLAHFDDVVVEEVVGNVPLDKFNADELSGLHQLMDEKIASTSAFALTPVRDLAPVGPAGFVACADNGGHCGGSASTGLVAFGAAGSYVTAELPTGGVTCSASSFAVDPNPSAYQTCFVPEQAGSALPIVKTCAQEGGTCRVTGTHPVAYGVGSTWVVQPVTGEIPCGATDPGFGKDPAPGRAKTCVVLAGSGPGSSPRAGQLSEPCADERGTCYISGRATIAFGSHGDTTGHAWVYKTVNGADHPRGLSCTLATFGADPLPGVTKKCVFVSPYAHFSYCAAAGGTCEVPEGARYQMAHGGDGGWVVRTVGSGRQRCAAEGFEDLTVLNGNTNNHCYLSAPDGDLVLGGEAYDTGNYGSRYRSMSCARDGADCPDTGSAMWAYGKYDGITGTYFVEDATEKADYCSFGGFTSRDPHLNVAHCFPLVDPGLNYDPSQTAFAFVEPAPAAPATETGTPPAPTEAQPAPVPAPRGELVVAEHGYCLESGADDRYVRLDDCDQSDAQRWEPVENSGLRTSDGRCLGVVSSSVGEYAVLADCTDAPGQAWQRDGGLLRVDGTRLCLAAPDSPKASRDHGSPLIVWTCSDPGMTKWKPADS